MTSRDSASIIHTVIASGHLMRFNNVLIQSKITTASGHELISVNKVMAIGINHSLHSYGQWVNSTCNGHNYTLFMYHISLHNLWYEGTVFPSSVMVIGSKNTGGR